MNRRTNPFPGMDPWMESRWSDVHTALIGYIRDALGFDLPEGLTASAEERVTLASTGYRADIAISEEESWRRGVPPQWTPLTGSADGLQLTKSIKVHVPEVVDRWIEIRTEAGELITVIEVISPGNKIGSSRSEYIKKRHDYLKEQFSLVEIDLVRGGDRIFEINLPKAANGKEATYGVCVRPWFERSSAYLYPIHLFEELPVIGIPLRPTDPIQPLALQPLIDRVHASGRYLQIPHRPEALDPRLAEDEAAWAIERLKQPVP